MDLFDKLNETAQNAANPAAQEPTDDIEFLDVELVEEPDEEPATPAAASSREPSSPGDGVKNEPTNVDLN